MAAKLKPEHYDRAVLLSLLRYSDREIAQELRCSTRTVERMRDRDEWDAAGRRVRASFGAEVKQAAELVLLKRLHAELAREKGPRTVDARWVLERVGDYLPPVQRSASDERVLHGVVELPAETEGKPSLDAAQVIAGVLPASTRAAAALQAEAEQALAEEPGETGQPEEASVAGRELLERLRRRKPRRPPSEDEGEDEDT